MARRSKSVFSILLTLALVLALFPAGTLKAGAASYDYIPASWEKLAAYLSLVDNVGRDVSIGLNTDIVAPASAGPLVVNGRYKITIDLRGHAINRNLASTAEHGSVIEVVNGGSLTVEDSVSGGSICGGNTTGDGGGVYVEGGYLTLNGGNITGNTAAKGAGGGVYVKGGYLTLNGGSITGNAAAKGAGGGVYVEGGYLTLDGGNITGNTAAKGAGGGVYICDNAKFTMNGGSISANEARYGGGLHIDGPAGWFVMTGGGINNNYALIGGGVYVFHGTMEMSGGVITGNHIRGLNQHSDLQSSTDGNADALEMPSGGVVVNSAGGAIGLSGTVDITGNEGGNVVLTGFAENEFMLITTTFSEQPLDAKASIGVSKYLVKQPFEQNPRLLMTVSRIGGAVTSGMRGKWSAGNFLGDDGSSVEANSSGEASLVSVAPKTLSLSVAGTAASSSLVVKLHNPESGQKAGELVAAWYDSDGRLLGIATGVILAQSGKTATKTFDRPEEAAGAASFKVMLLDVNNGFAPLCPACGG